MYNIPILILTYNRPEHLDVLLKALKSIKPKKIYISCDGPKNDFDLMQISKIKKKIKKTCKITKIYPNFLDKNHGIAIAPQLGIDWFFQHEEFGIILEDDCIPSKLFFSYMKSILIKYKNNKNIYAVSGYNHMSRTNFGDGTYFLSNYFLCWGWGTWKRSWNSSIKIFSKNLIKNEYKVLENKFKNKIELQYWKKTVKYISLKKIKTWDVQFLFSMWKLKKNCILPNINMIKNIGFDDNSTTSPGLNFKVAKKVKFVSKIITPKELKVNFKYDHIIFNNLFRPKNFLYPWRINYIFLILINNPKYFLKKLFRFLGL